MAALALRLAASLQRGRYIADPELAAEKLRRAYTDKPFAQQFVQWVVEMPSAEDARALAEYVGVNTRLGSRFVIGVASGRLFALLVAGSAMETVDSFETPESFASIANETRALLQEASR